MRLRPGKWQHGEEAKWEVSKDGEQRLPTFLGIKLKGPVSLARLFHDPDFHTATRRHVK